MDYLNLLFPKRCPLCDRPVPYARSKYGMCKECEETMPLISGASCYCCGKALSSDEAEYCADCTKMRGARYFERGFALCSYNDTIRTSVYKYKYGGRREYGEAYGKAMARRFYPFARQVGVDCIVPVPLHPERYKKRGYNQAELLAKELGKAWKIPVYTDLVIRVKNTPPMKLLGVSERQNNLKKAFKIGRNDVKSKVTIVIDDIYTTGSTIDEVSRLLKGYGVGQVYFLTLAVGEDI